MATNSKIEWTNRTWNVTTGCTKIAPGCANCYAEKMFRRLAGMKKNPSVYTGRRFTDVRVHYERFIDPATWVKPCMVFVNSMSDLFHEKVPFDEIHEIWDTMKACPQHVFQILTKRPERMKADVEMIYKLESLGYAQGFWEHVWLGVSVSTQADADKNIPILLNTPATVRWVSVEPLLENIGISFARFPETIEEVKHYQSTGRLPSFLDWVIVGCESGHKRRPCEIEWVESIVEQCKDAGVPVFVKQLNINGRVTKNIDEFPEHLRIREFPAND